MPSDIVRVDVPLKFSDSFESVDGNWELVEKKGWDGAPIQEACSLLMEVEARIDISAVASEEIPQRTP